MCFRFLQQELSLSKEFARTNPVGCSMETMEVALPFGVGQEPTGRARAFFEDRDQANLFLQALIWCYIKMVASQVHTIHPP
jgi:hypothetical protein